MTIALEGRTSAKRYQARHSTIPSKQEADTDVMLREIASMFRVALSIAIGGLVLALGAVASKSSTWFSAGCWVVVLAGSVGVVLFRAENMILRFAGRSGDGSAGGAGDHGPQVPDVEEPQAPESQCSGLTGGTGRDSGMCSHEDRGGGSDEPSGGSDDEGSLPLHNPGNERGEDLAGVAAGFAPIRPRHAGRSRERFALVRNQVAPSRGGIRSNGPVALSYLSRRGISRMSSISMLR